MLEAVSGLEPQAMNYLSLHMGTQENQEKVGWLWTNKNFETFVGFYCNASEARSKIKSKSNYLNSDIELDEINLNNQPKYRQSDI